MATAIRWNSLRYRRFAFQHKVAALPRHDRAHPRTISASSVFPGLEPGSYVLFVMPRHQLDEGTGVQTAPTYFPGAPSLAEAQAIVLERSQTISGVEIVVGEARAVPVSGTVIDADGQNPAPSGSITVRRLSDGGRDYGAVGTSLREGTFKLHLTPGEYELEARGMRPDVHGPAPPGAERLGQLRISVSGAPISDLAIQLAPAAVITGRIVFDGKAQAPDSPQAARIGLGGVAPTFMCNPGRSEVLADWTFRIEGASGTCRIQPMGVGRWTMKSAGRDDLDLLDQSFRLAPGQVLRDVEVVFTDRRTELTLDVSDEHGLPTRDYVALVFPPDRKQWNENSRFVRLYIPPPAAPAPTNGARAIAVAAPQRPDSIVGLPAGDYYVAVVEDLPVEGYREPAVLEGLATAARRVTLTESTPLRIALRRAPGPR